MIRLQPKTLRALVKAGLLTAEQAQANESPLLADVQRQALSDRIVGAAKRLKQPRKKKTVESDILKTAEHLVPGSTSNMSVSPGRVPPRHSVLDVPVPKHEIRSIEHGASALSRIPSGLGQTKQADAPITGLPTTPPPTPNGTTPEPAPMQPGAAAAAPPNDWVSTFINHPMVQGLMQRFGMSAQPAQPAQPAKQVVKPPVQPPGSMPRPSGSRYQPGRGWTAPSAAMQGYYADQRAGAAAKLTAGHQQIAAREQDRRLTANATSPMPPIAGQPAAPALSTAQEVSAPSMDAASKIASYTARVMLKAAAGVMSPTMQRITNTATDVPLPNVPTIGAGKGLLQPIKPIQPLPSLESLASVGRGTKPATPD